jgi:predicted thioesterase
VNGDLAVGLAREDETRVEEAHTAGHLGSGDVRVLASPIMILFMEVTARKLLADHLPEGQTSVGSRVDIRHLAPSPVGAVIRTRAEIIALEGRKVTLQVSAWDGAKKIGAGTHWRYIVDEQGFLKEVNR